MKKSIVVYGRTVYICGVKCIGDFKTVEIPMQKRPYNVDKIKKLVADIIGSSDFTVETVDREKV